MVRRSNFPGRAWWALHIKMSVLYGATAMTVGAVFIGLASGLIIVALKIFGW